MMPQTGQPQSFKPHLAILAGTASIATVIFLILIKLYATVENGSASVLASLIDSVSDASASLITYLAIRFSLKPADADHRFGHGKVEGLAALFQAAFIGGAGVFLLLESLRRFAAVAPPDDSTLAIAIMAVSAVISAALVMIQRYTLRHAPSLAVEADSTHYFMDILINVGVILILLALRSGAPHWVDPAFAILVACYLGVTVWKISCKGLDMLLDRELPDATRQDIARKILAQPGVLGMHDLRTRTSGMRMFISFDMELNPDLSLSAAHDIVRAVEHALFADYPNADILIHPDPHGDTHDTRHQVAGVHR